MRVNSYNKFFTEVAKIMNTEVKSVKPIDGRYKVELANHVCLNVYRGVSGSLFIHDRRGVAHITSCYDFDDFKTMKDLYERLISDYSESTNAETVTQTSEETNKTENCESTNNDIKGHIYVDSDSVKVAPLPEQQTSEESITDTIIADDNSSYNIEVLRAKQDLNTKYGNSYRKHLHAIINPEWHHVSLAALANIDNDMLDEKRRNYMYLYNLIKDFRKYAFEIIRKDVYFETTSNVFRNIQQLYFNTVISFTTYDYAAKHIQAVGVEKGWFDSKSEETFGYKESRRYKVTLR